MGSKNKFMAYYNGKKIFSIVKVASSSKGTLKALLDATKSCRNLFQKYSGASVDNLIGYEDTSNVTTMYEMFYECANLTSIPLLDTSNVNDMTEMFRDCHSLTSIPSLDTSNVTKIYGIFHNCFKLKSLPSIDTRKVTDFSLVFNSCYDLKSIPSIDVSNVTDMYAAFGYAYSIEEIHMTGMKVDFDIHYSSRFTREALLEIINNCQDLTGKSAKTITMGSTNLAKLTDEDKLIATNKNWTLA